MVKTDIELVQEKNYSALYQRFYKQIAGFSRYFPEDLRDDFCQNAYEYLVKAVDNTRMDTGWTKFSTILNYSLMKLKNDMLREYYAHKENEVPLDRDEQNCQEEGAGRNIVYSYASNRNKNSFYKYSPENMLESMSMEQKRLSYLDSLPSDYRLVVVRKEEGRTVAEISAQLKLPEKRIYRILDECRAWASKFFDVEWKNHNRQDLSQRLLTRKAKEMNGGVVVNGKAKIGGSARCCP